MVEKQAQTTATIVTPNRMQCMYIHVHKIGVAKCGKCSNSIQGRVRFGSGLGKEEIDGIHMKVKKK